MRRLVYILPACLPACKVSHEELQQKVTYRPQAKYSVMSHTPEITTVKSKLFSKTVNFSPQFQQRRPSGGNVASSQTPLRTCY
jgi:hypothetical protein